MFIKELTMQISQRTKLYIFSLMVATCAVLLIVASNIQKQPTASSPLGVLSDSELRARALEFARANGFQGTPTYEQHTYMPLGVWLTKQGANAANSALPLA